MTGPVIRAAGTPRREVPIDCNILTPATYPGAGVFSCSGAIHAVADADQYLETFSSIGVPVTK